MLGSYSTLLIANYRLMSISFLLMQNSAQETAKAEPENEKEPPGKNFLVKITPHLRKIAKNSPAVKREFFPSEEENINSDKVFSDPLSEDKFIKVKGLVHKYENRVLIELTMECAAYCRFCTRKRIVGEIEKGKLNKEDVKNMLTYVKSCPQINEIIFSGGDPFMAQELLIYALKEFSKIKQIKILRIHTRVPVSAPNLIRRKLILAISKIKNQALYLSIHFEHPDEFTKPTLKAIKELKKTEAILLCQSVFLKGVNDDYETLKTLFTRLTELGIRPYYLYRCDPVVGSEHFIVPFEKEIEIMTKLKKNLSGIACPQYVIDTPNGSGKVPVPLNFWKFDMESFTDYDNKKIEVIE